MRMVPLRVTSMTRFHSSSSISTSSFEVPRPALLIRISTPPSFSLGEVDQCPHVVFHRHVAHLAVDLACRPVSCLELIATADSSRPSWMSLITMARQRPRLLRRGGADARGKTDTGLPASGGTYQPPTLCLVDQAVALDVCHSWPSCHSCADRNPMDCAGMTRPVSCADSIQWIPACAGMTRPVIPTDSNPVDPRLHSGRAGPAEAGTTRDLRHLIGLSVPWACPGPARR